MPETVAAYIAANTLTAASVLTYSQILVLTYAGFAAATAAIGDYQRRKANAKMRRAYNENLDDRLVMTATAQAARSRVYGRVRNVDGVVFKGTHGARKEYYTLVVALAGHEVDAIETVYFNEVPVALDGAGYVQTEPYLQVSRKQGSVTTSSTTVTLPHAPIAGTTSGVYKPAGDGDDQFVVILSEVGNTVTFSGGAPNHVVTLTYEYQEAAPMARVRRYTGAPGQDLYADLQALVGAQVQPSDRFAGIACLLVTLQFDANAYPQGVPSISAVMRGARVFDPRTNTTGWTRNPALIARDWSLYANGGGCVADELVATSFTGAASVCDISTTFSTPAGAVVKPLYECDIVIPLDGNPDEALAEICESMAGQWGWSGGRLAVRAGAYRAPVDTITEDWVTGAEDIQITAGMAAADAVNVMRPTIADAAQHYVAAPIADVRAPAYISADGRELAREVQLSGVTSAVQAQHVCGVLMREAREALTIVLPCNLRAYPLELFDVVTLVLPRFGWQAGKLFEVVGRRMSLTGGVVLTLRETAAAIYQPDASFDVLTTSPNTALPRPQQVPALAGLAAASGMAQQLDGSAVARVQLTWAPVASEAVQQGGHIEVQYAEVLAGLPTGDWTSAPSVGGRATAADVVGLRMGVAVALRARVVNVLGMPGQWRMVVHKVVGRRSPRVYRQATEPSAADSQAGDTWFDSDAGNREHVYEAGAWVAVLAGTSALQPGAATTITAVSTAGPLGSPTPSTVVTVTPGAGEQLLVTAQASFSVNNADTVRRRHHGFFELVDGGTGALYVGTLMREYLAPGEDVYRPVYLEYVISAPVAGQTYTFAAVLNETTLTQLAGTIRDVVVKVEQIKR